MSDCVKEECASVAMVTLAEVHSEWQRQELVRALEEVGKVIAMEIENDLILEQVSQVGMQVLRYITSLRKHTSHCHLCTPSQRDSRGICCCGNVHM